MSHRSLHRRDALKSMIAAAAAPYVITSTALGNADTPPASERVTLGHLGVGGQGRGLLNAFMRCRGRRASPVPMPTRTAARRLPT
jgi:hypothetical protein